MDEGKKQRRARRSFTEEFKAEAVLVLDEGRTVSSAARDLDLTTSALRTWVERARADRTKGRTGLTSEERDRGSPYASEDYRDVLRERRITCSMSRKGNCYDNAVVESFFKTLKAELGSRFNNHGQAKEDVFDYIEIFYNQQRRHSALDYVSPAEYERSMQLRQAA